MRAAWAILGGLTLALGAFEYRSWLPGVTGLIGLAIWAAGLVLLLGSGRAARVEAAWGAGLRRTDTRVALLALAALWLLLVDMLGVYAALIVLTIAGFGTLIAAAAGARALATSLVNAALVGVSLTMALLGIEAILHLPGAAEQLGTPAERARWVEQRYDRLWRGNVFGFRSGHETLTRSPQTLRILALGDSFTWGDKIASSDSTWPSRLERALASDLPARDVEVINMGRNGFTTANEAELLRRLGWNFEPDVVILQYYRNDVLPSRPNFGRESSTYIAPPHRLLPTSFRQGRIASSALLDLLETRYSIWRNKSSVDPVFALYEDGFIGWEQVKDALREMGTAAAERGVPFYFVLFPTLERGVWDAESHPHRAIHREVITVAQAAGMRIVDLTRAFGDGRTEGQTWWATPYDRHPNARAHDVVARTLHTVLLADGIGSAQGETP